ncbi:MAG: hypothetical protein K5650_04050 [Bacteroidales bacterium]|nr:hypothetical protein [Bacteroidales bacterium]
MKKVLFYIGCAMFVASMTVACNSKKNVETVDSVAEETIEAAENAQPVEAATMSDAEHAAMLDAAREAGRAKCNCYKTDPASVESCIKSILSESYATYQDNEEFKSVMEEEFNSCVKEKVNTAAKDAADKGIKAGAEALSKKLNGNK